MNVKFKMPKFGRNLTGKGWFKELMMTFLGTTILSRPLGRQRPSV